MNDDVKNILNNLLVCRFIDTKTVYRFFKGNVSDVDALLEIIDSLVNEGKIGGTQAFVLIEYLSKLKLDLTAVPGDFQPINPDWWWWQRPYVTEPIYVKTAPDTTPIWNGGYTVSSQPTATYSTNNNTSYRNNNK